MANRRQNGHQKLISIFPVEIWQAIFNHIESVGDYRIICLTSTVFYNLFAPLRTKILFQSVAKIILNQWRQNPQRSTSRSCRGKELLPLRFVSVVWKKAVDNILQNLDIGYSGDPLEKFTRLPFQLNRIRLSTVFEHDHDLQEFMEEFDNNENPFITRSVVFVLSTTGYPLRSFYTHLYDMLCEFGHHIWYCEIVIRLGNWREHTDAFNLLGRILGVMPNLKRFQFTTETHVERIVHVDLENVMAERPIPQLKNLEFVTQNGMPVSVVQSLLKSNPQITTVDARLHQTGRHLQAYLEETPNLEALAVEIQCPRDFACFRDSGVVCRLKKLNIQMPALQVPLEHVFSWLNFNFAETLEELCIFLPSSTSCNKAEEGTLQLPRLKQLTISVHTIRGLDFVLPMRYNLENLSVMIHEFGFPFACQQYYVIKVFHSNGHNHRTNIWQAMEKLQMFNVWWGDGTECLTRNAKHEGSRFLNIH